MDVQHMVPGTGKRKTQQGQAAFLLHCNADTCRNIYI